MVQEIGLHFSRPFSRCNVCHAAAGRLAIEFGFDGLDMLGHHFRNIAMGSVFYGWTIIPGSCGIGPLLGIGTAFTGLAEFGDGGWPGAMLSTMIDTRLDLFPREAGDAFSPFGSQHIHIQSCQTIRP